MSEGIFLGPDFRISPEEFLESRNAGYRRNFGRAKDPGQAVRPKTDGEPGHVSEKPEPPAK